MGRIVGIDLGTTFSAVAAVNSLGKPEIIPNREGERITPSVVLFQGGATQVGSMARRSAATAPDDVVQFMKRQMGDPTWRFVTSSGDEYTPEQVSAIIVKRLKDDAEMMLGEPVTDAVITVPAYFDDARRKATVDAGTIAGLDVRRVLNEPTAAALAYGLDTQATGTVVVYDLGGGTFDVTVMRVGIGKFDILATMGDRNLGGFDWDNALMTYINEQVAASAGPDLFEDDLLTAEMRDKAEMAKRTLTTVTEAKVFLSVSGENYTVPISRAAFEDLTKGLLGRTEDIIETTLDDAGLTWPEIDKVLLVGGSTRMPMVQGMIRTLSGKEPERSINPDEVVALGAAIQAHVCAMESADAGSTLPVLAGTNGQAIDIRDVTALGLGVIALDETERQRNFVLIEHNAKIPAQARNTFCTVVENQTEILVSITEGDDTELDYIKIVGESTFAMPPYPRGSPIDVALSYDIDGIIHAEVFDGQTNTKLGDMEIEREANLDSSEVLQMTQDMQQLEIS